MATHTLTVTEELQHSLVVRVQSGQYHDEGAVLAAALSSLQREEEEQNEKLIALRTAIQEGLDSGLVEGSTKEVFDRVRARVGLPPRTH